MMVFDCLTLFRMAFDCLTLFRMVFEFLTLFMMVFDFLTLFRPSCLKSGLVSNDFIRRNVRIHLEVTSDFVKAVIEVIMLWFSVDS
jgi:hypothetical protein